VTKDDFLVAYSKLLATKGQLKDQDGQTSKEGWELAIQVLGRLDDSITASGRIEQILNELPLESSVRVDKITRLCHQLGLSQHALTIAQVCYRVVWLGGSLTNTYRNMPTISAQILRTMAIHSCTMLALMIHLKFRKSCECSSLIVSSSQ
jgi:hypothetical protein